MKCPKCHAAMHTYNRAGVHIEQCSGCRGIFLDYGELEALQRLEGGYQQPGYQQAPPPPAAPAWGAPTHHQTPHYGHGHGHRPQHGIGRLFYSS
ncbi:zf-TFIIB domain-containing protein [Nocardia sp. 2]|uniref:Zf-TFIIB domain-containing protein n=1 Tax=Nocardia acididurans TaxID=2802282 RepID=A0ABS1M647_9NOCA|nr:zf-TFIIB domain-containing protein [Nocardia acididurans]MBL1076031.1 zf-TFIIB domain-containing protein [Nocardia acididurans]